jgi:FtsP/CotA-like multicopper oxidase with cupredoxin domain
MDRISRKILRTDTFPSKNFHFHFPAIIFFSSLFLLFCSYPDPNPIILPMGKVQEWRFHGLLAHPFHIHITPFQIISLNVSLYPNTWFTSYFEVGDYHDTLLLPQMTPTGFGNSTSALVNPNDISKFLFKLIVCRLASKILTFFLFVCFL